jgi:hypothetical protein
MALVGPHAVAGKCGRRSINGPAVANGVTTLALLELMMEKRSGSIAILKDSQRNLDQSPAFQSFIGALAG